MIIKLLGHLSIPLFCSYLLVSCASYDQFKNITDDLEMPSEVYNANYNETWQAILQIMKTYDLAIQNQESGTIRTRWIDNTTKVNFSDSFGSSDSVKSAKFILKITVIKALRGTRQVSKVTIYKRQLVEQDFLQGWKEVPTDGILEKTLLYRVRRIITIDKTLQALEKQREQEQISNF